MQFIFYKYPEREERISQLGMMPLARDKVVRDQEYMTSFEVCVRTKRLVARGSETGEQIKRLINDFSLVKMNLALQVQLHIYRELFYWYILARCFMNSLIEL